MANEFENMPSIDCRQISRKTKMGGDLITKEHLNAARKIAEDHGFAFLALDDKCYLYKRIVYKQMLKVDALELHEALNEIDINTPFYIECSWPGNCGFFASNNVRDKFYPSCFGRLYSYESLECCYHDLFVRVPNGEYMLAELKEAKYDPKNVLGEFSVEAALEIALKHFPDKGIHLEHGKRACDTSSDSYDAIVVGHGKDQLGSIKFDTLPKGHVSMSVRRVLCGESSVLLAKDSFEKQIISAIARIN